MGVDVPLCETGVVEPSPLDGGGARDEAAAGLSSLLAYCWCEKKSQSEAACDIHGWNSPGWMAGRIPQGAFADTCI